MIISSIEIVEYTANKPFVIYASFLNISFQRLFLCDVILYYKLNQRGLIMNTRTLIAFLFMAMLIACKQDTSTPAVTTTDDISGLQTAMEKLNSEPGKESARNFVNEVRKELATPSEDQAKKMDLLLKGLDVAEEYKMGPSAIGFLMPLVKDYPDNPMHEEHFAKLASALHDIGKSIPADILISAYETKFPTGKFTDNLKPKQKEKIKDINSYVQALAENVFVNPDKFGINKVSAQKYVDACEAFAIGFPNDEMAPEYLYRSAEMARTLKTYPKALSIFDWIESKYPNFEKTPTIVFLKGFMLENELNNKEAARKVYEGFMKKYPNNDLTDDVKFLLDNIDKSDEEIMKMIDEKAKK